MPKAVIAGAGIIGLSAAYYLRHKGWEVTVLERSDLKDNCSFGNMGYLSPSHIVPLAAPGMIEQGLLWMFDPKSPFYIRPSLSPQLLDWGWKFMRHCTQAHVTRSVRPLLDLLLLSKTLYQEWAQTGDLQFDLQERGCVMYFQSAKKEKAELEAARMAIDHGLSATVLDRAGAHALEPDLLPEVNGGVWYKDDAHIQPAALMQQLPAYLEKNGVQIVRHAEVNGFERQGARTKAVRYEKDGETHLENADLVVIAGGSWSPAIAKAAGVYIPLMPGKGYSMDLSGMQKRLHYPCILLEAKVALTPWGDRLRIGSTMEIGAINDRILLPRAQGIIEAVPRFLPKYMDDPVFKTWYQELRGAVSGEALRGKVWFGFRPVSADGMPLIGYAPGSENLIVATGHAMLGLSLGPGTGKLVAELADHSALSMDTAAFRLQRFR